ncbi:hypothetical protein [Mycobacteroides chelonae]|uniref:hypothetical protein n=1 Tax=Mycobacteroides chelonae TaxID=1774 RepID=UPI00356B3744
MVLAVMARSAGEEEGAAFLDHVQGSELRVYNRLTATKPLNQLVSLLNLGDNLQARMPPEAPPKLPDSEDDSGSESDSAYLNVAAAIDADFFGIRVGAYVDAVNHVFVVDAAIEYDIDKDPFSFDEKEIEHFVRSVAAPRIAIATWTLLEEASSAVQYRMDGKMVIPPEAIAHSVMNAYRSSLKSEKELPRPSGPDNGMFEQER